MEELEHKLFYLFSFIPADPGIVLPWVITLMISVPLYLCSRNISVDCKTKGQAALELIYEGLENLVTEITGKEYAAKLLPILSAIFIYIFSANLLGLIPGFKSPTSLFSNCISMALIAFFSTFYIGFKEHGIGYLKHYTGAVWWMAPMMFPIHFIGELSRPVSLTLRLFGNIMGEDIVIMVLTIAIFPLLLPIPMLMMAIFTSFLQALVFTILCGVYFSEALSEAH